MARRKTLDDDDLPGGAPPPAQRRFVCVAHGCPTIAGIAFGTGETICRFHDGQTAGDWQGITHRLRGMEWAVRLCDWLYGREGPGTTPDWPRQARALALAHDRLDLAPSAAEADCPTLYAQRINRVVTFECCPQKRAPELLAAVKPAAGAARVGDVLGDAGW